MAWVRIDDQFADHPKAADAGPLGIAMQVAALCYANRHLTDGFISHAVAARLLDFTGIAEEIPSGPNPDDSIVTASRVMWLSVCDRLVAAGMWEPVERGWMIHDYLEYNPSRADTEAKRAADLERKRKPDRSASDSAWNPDGIRTDSKRPVPDPVPIPITSTKVSSDISVGEAETAPQKSPPPKPRATRGTPAPDNFPISDDMQEWADEHCPEVDLVAETERFLNRARSKGETYKDWPAAWKNWMTNPYPKTMRGGVSARAPAFAGNGYASREQAKFERSIEGLRNLGDRH